MESSDGRGRDLLKRIKTVGLALVVGGGALIPLYGDPRPSPVTHAEWARMLLRGMELDSALETVSGASQAFAILTWRNSLSFAADHYLRAEGVEVQRDGTLRRVVAQEAGAEVAYPLAVVRGGDYTLRLRIGAPQPTAAAAEVREIGDEKAEKTFSVAPLPVVPAWVVAGNVHLDPGAYTTSVVLPVGAALENVEVAPPCLAPVEPLGGWKALATTSTEDVAVTTLKAIDAESELPPADSPLEYAGSDFQTGSVILPAAVEPGGAGEIWLVAGAAGRDAVLFVDIREPGLYAVSTFGLVSQGQSWTADGCRKSVLCPRPDAAPDWHTVLTSLLGKGRHTFSVTLGPGSVIQRVRIERKRDLAQDYVETLKRLGFDVGPSGPITRQRAVDAMEFIKRKRKERLGEGCGDIVLAPTETAQLSPTGVQVQGPGVSPPFSGNPPTGPILVPFTPPGPPPTQPPPTVPPGPPPTTLTVPPTPFPTPLPTPTPCIPPASPTDPDPCA